jgi:hypothetical protein
VFARIFFISGFIVKSLKSIKLLVLVTALLGAMATGTAWAQHHGGGHHGGGHHGGGHWHGSVGLYFGAPLWPYYGAPYYPYSYYPYYYPYAVPAAQSPAYVEQGQAPSQNYWYFCSNPKGYYPYVNECPPGWAQVTPTPPPGK